MDILLVSNEMCGEGLREADGEDYWISDCKADRQLVGEGLISELLIHHSSFTLERRRRNHASLNQDDDHFLYLHHPHHAVGGLVEQVVFGRQLDSLGCMHLLLLHSPNAVRFSD